MIKIATILGTVRPGNYTSKALQLVQDELKNSGVEMIKIDPSKLSLSFPGINMDSSDGEWLRETVSEAIGVIMATPEYHGSFTSVLKLIIENLGFPSVLAAKPVAMLGVAGGRIGAIKSLEHLRSVCSHIGAIVLPGPVSVANIRSVFDEQGNCIDEKMEKTIRGLAHSLLDYIHSNLCPRTALEEMVRNAG
jgi:FMN reductase